jgi:hypothetical protein
MTEQSLEWQVLLEHIEKSNPVHNKWGTREW